MKQKLTTEKEKISSKFRIGKTCFTSVAVIGDKLFSNNPKNMNHVHKNTQDFACYNNYGDYYKSRDTVFYEGVKTYDLESIAHALEHLYSRMIFGKFENVIMKVLFGEYPEH